MPVTFYCPKCKTPLRITRRKIGESVACPKCAATMTVPEADEPAPVEEAAVGAAAGIAPSTKQPGPQAPADGDDEEYEDEEEDEEELISEFIVYDEGSQSNLPNVDSEERKNESVAPPGTPAASPPTSGPATPAAVTATSDAPPAKGGVKLPPPTTGSFQVPAGMILLPRRALFILTCLFMGVAVGAFYIGYLIGQGDKKGGAIVEVSGPVHNVIVEGRLTYITPAGSVAGDSGAILIALPQASSPDPKLPHIGLRPDEIAELGLGNEMATLIRKAGGNVVQADRDGAFLFTVPRPDKYFLLAISRKADRSASRPVSAEDLAMINRYFLNPESLIGKKKYLWKLETLEPAGPSQVHSFGEADQ